MYLHTYIFMYIYIFVYLFVHLYIHMYTLYTFIYFTICVYLYIDIDIDIDTVLISWFVFCTHNEHGLTYGQWFARCKCSSCQSTSNAILGRACLSTRLEIKLAEGETVDEVMKIYQGKRSTIEASFPGNKQSEGHCPASGWLTSTLEHLKKTIQKKQE